MPIAKSSRRYGGLTYSSQVAAWSDAVLLSMSTATDTPGGSRSQRHERMCESRSTSTGKHA